jgi:FHS family L-fucose permease-like MFS transporter
VTTSSSHQPNRVAPIGERQALIVLTVIFFMWGFITSLNDILIPHLKSLFDLNYAGIMLIQFTFFGAYFVMSLPSSWIVGRLGYPASMGSGLALSALGAFLFEPAALWVSYPCFLAALFILASGITLLQVAANPYVTLLGSPGGGASRLNLAQALNSLGTTLGPVIGGVLILAVPTVAPALRAHWSTLLDQAYRLKQSSLVEGPYLGLGLLLALFAVGVFLLRLPALSGARSARLPVDLLREVFEDLPRYRHLLWGMLGIFLYVGAEVTIGSFMISYISQPRYGGIPLDRAALFVSLYWMGAMCGRFIGSGILRRVDAGRLLGLCAIVNVLLVSTTLLARGDLAVGTIVATGLFNSIMFPNIFALAIADLGPRTAEASGLLVMAIVGGAVIPLMQGFLADRIGIHHAYLLPLGCYLYLVFYGFRGSRVVEAESPRALTAGLPGG